jgi:hypothetical protein
MTTKEKVQDYTIAISLPTANVSKEQEISVVNRLRNYFKPTYTYLQSFFSDELVSWLEYNIKNDMSCDLMENYKNTSDKLHKMDEEREELRKLINLRDATIEDQKNGIAALDERIYELRTESDELYNKCEEKYTAMLELESMHAAEVKSLKWKITVLKAKLFDEMTRSGLLT